MIIRRGALVAFVMVMAAAGILSACGGDDELNCDDILNDADTPEECRTYNANLPGTFVAPQGREHFNYTFDPDRTPRAFCAGVATSKNPGAPSVETDAVNCYASNPPSSGSHLPSQPNVEVAPGARINIPPDPDVYPPDIEIPREAIPHLLEHAGVFVGYNCDVGGSACDAVVTQLGRAVNDRIDDGKRVVMARDSDLPAGTVGMSSWTRVETFAYTDFTEDRVVAFIDTHSCRFDPEGFC